jgi:PAS domain S-box-containing protein
LFVHTGESSPPASGAEEGNKIRVAGINIEWAPKLGTCTFANLPVAMMWVDTTLAGLMSGVQAMVGTERFLLALQSQGRKSVDTDWEVISQFPNFPEGFRAIANIAGVAGWGTWELTSLDLKKRECRFRVSESWEGLYQKALGVSWGSGMLAGKMAGYCTRLFGTDCWADQTAFIAKGDPYDEFLVRPSSRSLEQEIENLLASDEATRADMAVTMRKLEEEVAERQRAEEVLREYHQKLEALIHASPLSIFVLDPEGRILLWNPASESTFGWSAEEVLGRVLPIVPEDKEEEFWNNLRRGLAGDSLKGVELRRRKKDGAPIDINVYTSPLYDSQGQVTGLMVVDADVTERKRADELIKLNESRLEALLQLNQMTDASLSEITKFAMEEAIRLTGSKIGYIAFMNEDETVLTMHAWSRAAMSECRIADKPRKYPVETTGLWGEAVRQRRPIITNDYGAANPWKKGYPEGHVHIARHMNAPIFDGQKIVIVAGVGNKPADYDESDVRQLTLLMEGMWRMLQRNQAEAELEQSISLLKATLESTADGLLVVDNFGKIVAYNQKFAQMWRIPEEILASKDDDRALAFVLEQLKAPRDFIRKVQELYDEQEAESFDLIEFKDGRVFERFSQPQRIGETIVGRVWSFRDVTKRRQAEEALRESREDLNRAQAVAHTGSWRLDTRRNELLWSDETHRIFCIPKGTPLTYEYFLASVLPEDREYVDRKWTAALQGEPYDIEHRILVQGTVKWVREKAELECDSQGMLVGGFGTVQDITERKQADEALRESEEKYRKLMETAHDAIFIADADTGVILEANCKAQELLGLPREKIIGLHQSQVHPPEEAERYKRIFREHSEKGGVISEDIYVADSRGRRIPVEIGASVIEVKGKKLTYGIFRNLTAQRQAEDALRRSEEKYRLLVNQIPAVVFEGYPDWSVDFFDNKVEALTGYSKEDFDSRRRKWRNVVLPEDLEYAKRVLMDALKADGAFVREHRIRRKDGEIRWIQCRGQIRYNAQGKIDSISGVTFDITERKQAEEELRDREAKLSSIFRAAPIGIGLVKDRVIQEVNDWILEMTGYSAQELIGQSARMLYPTQEDFDFVGQEKYRQITAKGTGTVETRWRRKDGSIIEVLLSSTPLVAGDLCSGVTFVVLDITKRKRAEQALRESEEKYRLLVNQIPAVVFKGYPDWSVDFFDNKIEGLVGYGKKEFDSRRLKWSDLILPDDFQEIKRRSREAIHNRFSSYEREYRIRKKDGGIAWVQAMGQRFYDAAGRLDYTSGVFLDITRRKRAEEALLNYEFIANTAKDCMTLIDRNYVYVAANTAYCRAHDKPLEEMVGAGVAQIWGEDTFNNVIRGYLDQCFAGRAVEYEGWFEFGKHGMGCFHVFYNPYFDASGKVVYAAVVSRDITERKKVEEALRQSEMKYRQLVDQIPAVVYKGYTDWTMDCFDEKVKAITGYSQEDFTSRRKSWLDLIFPEDVDQAKKLFREALKGDGFYVTEHHIRRKDGQVRWIQARNRIIRDVAGKVDHISGVFFDLTERKELEDQLNKAQRMEAIGILAGGLAHDFNNLLTAIMGYGEIMSLGLRKEDPFYLYVEEISKAANRGAALTDQLLAFSRKQILQPRVVNLNEVVLDMDQMLRRLIGEDIELATVVERDLGMVKADPGQIEQIIMNMAVNARDAMPEGGKLTVETANIMLDEAYARSHVDVTPGPYVMLAVSDNGVGMNADTMSRIFEPFFTTKESGKGTGLGLATAYGIVKQSGGHIWVYSEPEQGTTFKIYLPRVKEAPVAEKPKAAAPASLEGKETILVVEDDAALRELIGTALRKYGFKVLEAPHGGEALLICEKQKDPIHLMLTDVVMPQISGTALAERLKGLHPEMRVLYMSGYTENAIVHHGVLDARVNFIPKPFRVLALVEKVREVLDAPEPDNNHS